jgi:hypothetical protein
MEFFDFFFKNKVGLNFDIFWIYMLWESGVSKISYDFILRALLGIQVPQHDVYSKLPNHKKRWVESRRWKRFYLTKHFSGRVYQSWVYLHNGQTRMSVTHFPNFDPSAHTVRHSPQLCTSSTYTASSWKRNIKTRFASKTPLINA